MSDYKAITLDEAKQAVRAYNSGRYRCKLNTEIDHEARQIFANGLASSEEDILRQVHFIGKDYGGVAGFPSAISLAPRIASDIYADSARYIDLVKNAVPLLQAPSNIEVIKELYRPFVKPLHNKQNWQVWATKFWHFLNPEAFPVEDSRVDKFFCIGLANSPKKYIALLKRFREFALGRQEWLPQLWEVDGGHAWCDNKIWDKVFYGVKEHGQCHS